MHIDHINIRASAELLERVKTFYCEVLGLNEGFRPNFTFPGYWLYAGPNAVIHLSEEVSMDAARSTGSLDHVAFQVDDLTPVVDRLNELGIEHKKVRVSDIAMTQIFFRDPAGLRIEVNCFDRSPDAD